MSDPLIQLCIDYAKEIRNLRILMNILGGMNVVWIIVCMIQHSIIKVYEREENEDERIS